MATNNNSANGTSKKIIIKKKQEYEKNQKKRNIEQYENAADALRQIRDATKTSTTTITTFTKESLRSALSSIGSNEVNLRNISRYLYYRSHIYSRIVSFYANMFDLKCRKVVPKYDLTKTNQDSSMLKNYNATLDLLERYNLQDTMTEVLTRCFIDDVCYTIFFQDESGAFFYILDPDTCKIDSRYMTGEYGFSIDMSKWKSSTKQQEIEWLGEPLVSMYKEYESSGVKWVHCDDAYAAAFKFRTEDWQTVIPPFIGLFQSLINLEDLADVQAIADSQQIYKLLYIPMKVLSGTKQSDDFEITPDLTIKYLNRLISEALPDYTSAAVIPGDELKVVDFADNAANDTDRLEQAASTILNTSGGGMVLNTSKITTQAGFEAALKCETEYAVSTLIPQINGFCNRMLVNELGDKAANVEHFEVSVYTKDKLADKLLESCQYSFANRLAYNTCLGISEKDTLAMIYLENTVLGLQDIMIYPLASSYTQSGTETTSEVGQGAPTKDASDLSDSGSKSRDN